MEIADKLYGADMEEAIHQMLDLHRGQDQKVDKRSKRFRITRYGYKEDITRSQLIARFGPTYSHQAKTRKREISVQKWIRRKDNWVLKFGEVRGGGPYIESLEFRRGYCDGFPRAK